MSDLRKNSFEDDDFRTVLTEIEEADEEAESIMASARGKVSAIRKRQKNRIKIAKQELGIPSDVLRAVLKQRKLEQKLKALAGDVSDDLIEVYEDAAGQFSLFAPAEGEAPAETGAQAAARERKAEIAAASHAEQAEGAAALEELAGASVN
jgi:hypothetical protein